MITEASDITLRHQANAVAEELALGLDLEHLLV
jgi:hypothetical protein